jgi:hypothetical protein
MEHLEVSGVVRPLKWPLGVKWLRNITYSALKRQSFYGQILCFVTANQTLAITQVIHWFTLNSIQKSLLNVYIQQLKPKLKQRLKPPQSVPFSFISFGTRIAWSPELLLWKQLPIYVARFKFKRHHFKLHFKVKFTIYASPCISKIWLLKRNVPAEMKIL